MFICVCFYKMNTPSDYPDQGTEASVRLPHLQIEGTCCSEEFIAENQEAMFYRDRLYNMDEKQPILGIPLKIWSLAV